MSMSDEEIVQRIGELVSEEHDLEREHTGAGISETDRDRLRSLEIQLDQCWDLLRQRRARRSAGQDPNESHVRPAEVVENYRQ
jgi:Protein of unknown function (DUF2630)